MGREETRKKTREGCETRVAPVGESCAERVRFLKQVADAGVRNHSNDM